MGLVSDEVDGKTQYVALTDILGAEDAFGDMDFKVAGTREFVTALQLDTKLDGIPSRRAGRGADSRPATPGCTILDVMTEAIDEPDEMSPYAPRVTTVKIPVDKIGEVIGPKGKIINAIQDETGAEISIEDDGTIYVGAADGAVREAAVRPDQRDRQPAAAEGRRAVPRHGGEDRRVRRLRLAAARPGRAGAHLQMQARQRQADRQGRGRGQGRRQAAGRDRRDRPRGKISLDKVAPRASSGARPSAASARPTRAGRPRPERPRPGRARDRGRGAATGSRAASGAVAPVRGRPASRGGDRRAEPRYPHRRGRGRRWAVGPPDRAARRAARRHRAGARRALGRVRRLGRRRLPGRDAGAVRRLALPGAPAVQGHPATRPRWTSRRRWTRSAARLNAFTAKEYTCYYARVLDDDLPLAVDVICDMVTDVGARPAGRGDRARRDPRRDRHARRRPGRRWSTTLFAEALFGDPARPAGDRHVEIDQGADPDRIAGYYRRRYTPDAHGGRGGRRHRPRHRGPAGRGRRSPAGWTAAAAPLPPRSGSPPGAAPGAPDRSSCNGRPSRPTSSSAAPALARGDERRFALGVLNDALGGGMSSRLFQEIREKRGLAYSVYSFTRSYADAGQFGVYAGCHPARCRRGAALCREQLAGCGRHGITDAEELDRGKGQCAAGWCSAWRTPARG